MASTSKKRSGSGGGESPFASPVRPVTKKPRHGEDELSPTSGRGRIDNAEETASPSHNELRFFAESSPPPETQQATQLAASQAVGFPEGSDSQSEISGGVWGYLIHARDPRQNTVLRKRINDGSNTCSQNEGRTSGYLIGRHKECDVILNNPEVSNRHCVIYMESGVDGTVAVLEDLSSNGTSISGSLVGRNKRRRLKDGDEIEVHPKDSFIFRYPKHRFQGRFEEAYQLSDLLGSGHFASVYKATNKQTGELVAVKVFKSKTKPQAFEQEVGVLMSVNHKNILVLKETFDERDAVYLVLEMAEKGELFNMIIDQRYLEEEDCRKIFIQLFDGLKYLHERNIVHRDIKPENILVVDDNLTVKLADFGLAKIIGEDSFTTSLCGTPSYVAPEVLNNSKDRRYSKPVDIWSLGVVLYICLVGFPPFSDDLYTPEEPYTLVQQILAARFDFPSPYWDRIEDPALDLITRMLTLDPEKRIKVEDTFRHQWFFNSKSSDITDRLVGSFEKLKFDRKRVVRQRTLVSEASESRIASQRSPKRPSPAIEISEIDSQEVADGKLASSASPGAKKPTSNGAPASASDGKEGEAADSEPARNATDLEKQEFMAVGGEVGQPLFPEGSTMSALSEYDIGEKRGVRAL